MPLSIGRALAVLFAAALLLFVAVPAVLSAPDGPAAAAQAPASAVAEARPVADREDAAAIDRDAEAEALAVARAAEPDRSIVTEAGGDWVATFTDGSRTVTLAGPERVLDEETATYPVRTATWVRLLPEPFDGTVDHDWLAAAREDRSPDMLALAMEYLPGAPEARDADGLLIAGDADYGPLVDGTRPIGSDWNDYQQVPGRYPTGAEDPPEAHEVGSLDCSGYMRMVLGIRMGLPLGLQPDGGDFLPRRSREQAAHGPGTVVVPNTGEQVTGFDRLAPGDLVFQDAKFDGAIDHMGMYLGVDEGGHHRFVSSRRSANGPTMGDANGWSVLDGDGLYARSFRTARRV